MECYKVTLLLLSKKQCFKLQHSRENTAQPLTQRASVMTLDVAGMTIPPHVIIPPLILLNASNIDVYS